MYNFEVRRNNNHVVCYGGGYERLEDAQSRAESISKFRNADVYRIFKTVGNEEIVVKEVFKTNN